MPESEIAAFREKQALEETSAYSGLRGPAIVARHDFIEARMERQGEHLLQLLKEGRYEEVERQMNLPGWEEEAGSHVAL